MATDKNTIKNWFKTGLKPLQEQFWAWMDSFWHKDEMIPITAIEELETILNEKADAEALTNHVDDDNAHAALFAEPNARLAVLEAKTDTENNFKTITGYSLNPATRVLTMNAGWVGTINGIDHTNVAAQELPAVPLANSGYSRIDLIVFDNAATFERIAGTESTFTPIAPPKPLNTLEATFLTVGDGVVNAPVIPKPKAPVTSVNGMRGDVVLAAINDLVTGGIYDFLSAEQGKVLKTQIDNINTLLASDNVNLDNVQELVDAIETVQTSLSTILVNDLTTGGTTKALTAEMGKSLKVLIDGLTTAVAGKQAALVSGSNIKTVGGVSILGTGDIAVASSLVTLSDFNYSGGYTFGLTDANKIISQQYSVDSTFTLPTNAVVAFPIGTVLQYHQRGAGAINLVATGSTFIGNVKMRIVTGETVKLIKIDVNTWFMNIDQVLTRELKFDAYPSTRNDGNIPHNKILSTDISGNVKLYSQGTFPKPYLTYLVPDTTLPNATAFFTLKGAFFTQTMTVIFTGQTVNFITFISDSEVRVNVTTGGALGMFSVILNNGAEAIYNNAFTITLGTIYIAQPAEWVNKIGVDTDTAGEVKMTTFGIATNAEWNRVLDYTKNWILRWNVTKSPLGVYPNGIYQTEFIKVMLADGSKAVISHQVYNHGSNNKSHQVASFNDGWRSGANFGLELSDSVNFPFELRYQGGIFSAYNGPTLIATFTDTVSQNMRLVTKCPYYDYRDIKYIETV